MRSLSCTVTPAIAAPLFILTAITIGIVPLILFASNTGNIAWPDAYAWGILRFTLWQATLSTILSVIPAIVTARALARRRFWGRSVLLMLFAVPLSLPVIVAVFGITALYGNAGSFKGWINLYGLGGIVLAHVFFNLPLATRLLLESLNATAGENHRLAVQLNFSDPAVFKHVDWPALKPALPRIAALVFLLSASSFVIVLIFGGPQATTLEVAIYQSLRMDFDVPRALILTLMQISLSIVLVWAAAKALLAPDKQPAQLSAPQRYDGQSPASRVGDFAYILAASLLVLPVLITVLLQGIAHLSLSPAMLQASVTSILIAILTTFIALPLAWSLSKAQALYPQWRSTLSTLSLAGFIVPPAVIATGWFLAFRNFDGGLTLAIASIAMLNALMCLPFLLAVLAPAVEKAAWQHDHLCAQLNLRGWNRFTLIDAPALRSPLAQAAMMALVLSMGDLTAVTLLGSQGLLTLPSLVQQQMGHYQSDEAGGTALVLAAICILSTFLAQRFSRWT